MAFFFQDAKDVRVEGPIIVSITQGGHTNYRDEGLDILYEQAVHTALHNSKERSHAPYCYPGTRVALQEEILAWLDDPNNTQSTMWLNGDPGAGKSAIAQTIAELCYGRGQLSSSFFFARADPERNNANRLVATLAYEMANLIPETQPHLSAAIYRNPRIFEDSLQSQIDTLIIGPLSRLQIYAIFKPMLIIIDGLDECESVSAQDDVVKTFVSAINAMRQRIEMPHKLLIVSRPATNIKATFDDPVISGTSKQLSVDERRLSDADIRKFLEDSFAEIRRTRPVEGFLSADWPSVRDIDELLRKSSGQFIYASVVIKFLQSQHNYPIRCLKDILGIAKDTKSSPGPYAELDALYALIFSKSNSENIGLLLRILCLHLIRPDDDSVMLDKVEGILRLPRGMAHSALHDLVPLVRIASGAPFYITFLHASFSDFLKDPLRSGIYHPLAQDICADVAQHCIDTFIEAEQSADSGLLFVCLDTLPKLVDLCSAEAQMSIYSAMSSMKFMSCIERTLTKELGRARTEYTSKLSVLGYFINWIVAKYLAGNTGNNLATSIEEIRAWILTQNERFPFNRFSDAGAALWTLGTVRRNQFNLKEVLKGLLIIYPSLNTEQMPVSELTGLITPSAQIFWDLMVEISIDSDEVLSNPELLGTYAMTEDRRLEATTRICENLLAFTRRINVDILHAVFWTLGGALNLLSPNAELCALLEQARADDISIRADFEITEDSLATYAYFWRKFRSSNVNRVSFHDGLYVLTDVIYGYIQRTRKFIPKIDSHTGGPSKEEEQIISDTKESRTDMLTQQETRETGV